VRIMIFIVFIDSLDAVQNLIGYEAAARRSDCDTNRLVCFFSSSDSHVFKQGPKPFNYTII
jgi:hypothetical protein